MVFLFYRLSGLYQKIHCKTVLHSSKRVFLLFLIYKKKIQPESVLRYQTLWRILWVVIFIVTSVFSLSELQNDYDRNVKNSSLSKPTKQVFFMPFDTRVEISKVTY